MFRTLSVLLAVPCIAAAQSMHLTHPFSGLDAASSPHRLERGGPRPYGPRIDCYAMPCPSAVEVFPGLRVPSQTSDVRPPVSLIRVVKSKFRFAEHDLGIVDTWDVLFFGESRLTRLRIYLRSSDQSFQQQWMNQLQKYFDFLDRDADGELNRHETEFVFSNTGMRQMIRAGYAYQRPEDSARTFADMDVDQDGRISFDEFAYYFAPSAGQLITAIPNLVTDPLSDRVTNALFDLIDINKDGKISQAEIKAFESRMSSLDIDEDDCLSVSEVLPRLFNQPTIAPAPRVVGEQTTQAFPGGTIPDSILESILSKYDRDKNLRLTKAENPFGDETFRVLDINGDGQITLAELLVWKALPPDLVMDMILGTKPEESAIRLMPPNAPMPTGFSFKLSPAGVAVLSIGTQTIQLSCYLPTGIYSQTAPRAGLIFADGGKGYITEREIVGPQFQAFRVLFDLIDRDNDGKLTRQEFDSFVALQTSFLRLPLSLAHSGQVPSLFQLMDANGDGRLSVQEIRDTWPRLIAREPKERDFVTRAALQPQGVIRFGREADMATINPNTVSNLPVRALARGPIWFRKFDRNGDGEVSRSEFPGTDEEFARLDLNKDGFVSLEEAEAAEKTLRAKK